MVAKASVVIHAHDEEGAVGAMLHVLLESARAADSDMIGVTSGRTDTTDDVARTAGAGLGIALEVVAIAKASKTAALNAGDQVAIAFPRVYLDANVACPTATLLSMVAVLHHAGMYLAVAARRPDLGHTSWWVRRYDRTWSALPRVRSALLRRGAYAFSRASRARFGALPQIVADGSWAVRQVRSYRAVAVPEEIVIRPPLDLASLVRVCSRIHAGNRVAWFPADQGASGLSDLRFLIRHPRHWSAAADFNGTTAAVKAIGVQQHSNGRDRGRGSLQRPPRARGS